MRHDGSSRERRDPRAALIMPPPTSAPSTVSTAVTIPVEGLSLLDRHGVILGRSGPVSRTAQITRIVTPCPQPTPTAGQDPPAPIPRRPSARPQRETLQRSENSCRPLRQTAPAETVQPSHQTSQYPAAKREKPSASATQAPLRPALPSPSQRPATGAVLPQPRHGTPQHRIQDSP